MSQKNNIEIIISAVDNISKTLQDTSKKLTGFVELNEINFRKMHDVGSRVFQGLASNILEFTDSSAKLQEASSAMDQLAKNIGQNSQDIMQSLRTASK